jgi:hypothetical protein
LGGPPMGATVPFGGMAAGSGGGGGVNSTRPVVLTTQAYASRIDVSRSRHSWLGKHTKRHHPLGYLLFGEREFQVHIHS